MTHDLVTITPDQTIKEAMMLMTGNQCRHLPVLKDGQLDGILSIGDLVKSIISGQEFEIRMLQDYIDGR
jgi:CBS domain-containing protein